MPQSADAYRNGEQGSISKPRLQRTIDERNGFCDDDLSIGVHVSCYSSAANVHEVNLREPFFHFE